MGNKPPSYKPPQDHGGDFEISVDANNNKTYRWRGYRRESDPMPPHFDPRKHRIVSADYQLATSGPLWMPDDAPVTITPSDMRTHCTLRWEDRCDNVGGMTSWEGSYAANPMLGGGGGAGGDSSGMVSPAMLDAWFKELTAGQGSDTLGGTDTQEEDSLLKYVRHGLKPTKTPCAACGSTALYWGHETLSGVKFSGKEDNFCKRCEVAGVSVLINEDSTLHQCVKEVEAKPDGIAPQGIPGNVGSLEPMDDEVPQERPDLQGDDADEDPWDSPPPLGQEPSEADEAAEAAADAEDIDWSDPDYPNNPSRVPPWSKKAQSQGQGEDESSEDDEEPDKYVLRVEWAEAREVDGQYLETKIDNCDKKRAVQVRLLGRRITNQAEKIKTHGQLILTHGNDITKLDSIVREVRRELCYLQENGVQAGHGGETVIKIERPDGTQYTLPDLHHYQLPLVLKFASARMHVLMVGTPAVGKSKLARQTAKALELPFYALAGSLNPMTSKTDIVGYMNSVGEYVGTAFYEAFTKGGVMFLDEMDNAHPAALAAINDAAAIDPGETVGFPNGMQERHPDFILLGAANTFGRGPTQAFSGRQRADAATWDRFNIIETQIDDVLEMTLASRTGAPLQVVDEIVRFVRRCRKVAAEKHLPFVITPRATVDMCKAYTQNISVEDMIDARIRRGTSDQDWEKLTAGMRMLALDDIAVSA